MASTGEVGTASKFIEVIKDLPSWLLSALAVASNLLCFVPTLKALLPPEAKGWVVVAAVVFTLLTLFKWGNALIAYLHARHVTGKAKKTFHLSLIGQRSMWHVAKQSDDSMVTQITVDLVIKNQTSGPVGLVSAKLIKPMIKGEVLHSDVLVREPQGRTYGTAHASDHRVPAGEALPARLTMMIRGTPKTAVDQPLQVTIEVGDEDGNAQRIRVACKGSAPAKQADPPVTLEPLYSIPDPVEKEVAAVLQSELSRYEKCGRQVGGLGSVHMTYHGKAMTGMGSEMWITNSAANQEIASDPESAELCSDNLNALIAFYGRLATDAERGQFVGALINRIDKEKGYASATYLIVCVLWKVGHLAEGLECVRARMPQGETKTFGFSNTLMMINGLLRYRHPDFTVEMLDQIERFIHGLTEHTFKIPQKIAAIRARRLAS